MGAYAELRRPDWLAAQMLLREMDCADVARAVNAQFGTRTKPQVVSRQFVSRLKNGKTKRCTPFLAECICSVLNVATQSFFVLSEPHNSVPHSAQPRSAA